MRLTFDTNVLLSATLWEGSSAQKLLRRCLLAGDTISSPDILIEYQRVLGRDFNYSKDETGAIIRHIRAIVELVPGTERINAMLEDPDDNKILECAMESRSEYIATYDRHLLKLGSYKGIKIRKPDEISDKQ
jgi:uncharacterized protein